MNLPKRGNAPGQRMQEIDGATIVMPQIFHWSTSQTVLLKAERVLPAEKLVGYFEGTCRRVRRRTKPWRGGGHVGLVRDENDHHRSLRSIGSRIMHEEQIKCVNQHQEGNEKITTSSGSDEYIMITIMRKERSGFEDPERQIPSVTFGKKVVERDRQIIPGYETLCLLMLYSSCC